MGGLHQFHPEHKANIGAFWNNATEATSAFTDAGCTIGQTWDTTGILLAASGPQVGATARPRRGSSPGSTASPYRPGAENVDQAYEFINFILTPENGGAFSNAHRLQLLRRRGPRTTSPRTNKKIFKEVYTPEVLDNLWWWPAETPWFRRLLRSIRRSGLTNA